MKTRQLRIGSSINRNAQSGAVLVVALILLLVLTFIGVSTMESTGTEMKMANQSRERLIATQAAEAGLRAAETFMQTTGFSVNEVSNTSCTAASQHCFQANCSDNGYCFNGANANSVTLCSLNTSSTPVWEDASLSVWSTAGRHEVLAAPNIEATVNYIVEFMCYIPTDVTQALSNTNASYLFRITSLATSRTGKSRVMLQSTYRVKL